MTAEEILKKINETEECFYKIFGLISNEQYTQATVYIQNYFQCDENTAKICCLDFKNKVYDRIMKPDPNLTPQEIARVNREAQEALNKPKCPICGSMNLTKISTVGKVAKVGFFGIFGAGDIGKTWKCNNCGSKF